MKHLFAVFLCLLSLSSCNVNVQQPAFPVFPTGKVSVLCNGIQYEAEINVDNNSSMVVSVMSPSELSGIDLAFSGDKCRISNDDISLNYPVEAIDDSPFIILNEVINQLNIQKPEFSEDNTALCAEIICKEKACKVICSIENKKLIEIQYDNLRFILSEVT